MLYLLQPEGAKELNKFINECMQIHYSNPSNNTKLGVQNILKTGVLLSARGGGMEEQHADKDRAKEATVIPGR